MTALRLVEIRTFPVKGLRGGAPASASLERAGLAGDRRWMVVDKSGRFLSQRELPHMALVQAENAQAGLHLSAPGQPTLSVATPPGDAPRRRVTVWRDSVLAAAGDPAADAWLSQVLGVACCLVYLSDPEARPVNPTFAHQGDVVSFADGYPVLLTTTASLADLNSRLASPIPMLRFRANLVVEGAAPWAEDGWRRVRIGRARLRVVKPCDRCVVTTIDPQTGQRPDPEEPLATLKTFRRDAAGRVLFGQNLVPEECGSLSVGDEVYPE